MFEKVLSEQALEAVSVLAPAVKDFYLAGGTGLALQLGHRKSDDLDFFSDRMFNADALLASIPYDVQVFTELGTVHCQVKGIRVSLLYYEPPLIYPPLRWHNIEVADVRDIGAEKIKTISQRGAKKDFIDLFAILKLKYSIAEVCGFFGQRFKDSHVNRYHVLKSLTFFEDAEQDPAPEMLIEDADWEWEGIKDFFVQNIELFEQALSEGF